MARGERDSNPRSKRLAESDDALRRDAACDRGCISRFAVELEPLFAWRAGRAGIAAIFDRHDPHARFGHGAKALDPEVEAAGVAMKIEDQGPAWRGRNAPGDQTLAILGLQTNNLRLEAEGRRIDFGGVAAKQDFPLAEKKPDERHGVERDAGCDRDQHRPDPRAALSAGGPSRSHRSSSSRRRTASACCRERTVHSRRPRIPSPSRV